METENKSTGRKVVNFTISLDSELLALVTQRCAALHRSRSNYIGTLLAADLEGKIALVKG